MSRKQRVEVKEDIIIKAKTGDVRAWEVIVRLYEQEIFNFCYGKFVGQRDPVGIAQEAAQDTFIRAWRGIKGFKGKSRFSTWLYRIASNVCKDLLKKRGKAPPITVETDIMSSCNDDEGKPATVDSLFGDDTLSPERVALKSDEEELILRCLSKLSKERKDMIYLVYYNGLTYKEAASILGCPEGKVKSGVHRAIDALRRCVDTLLGEKDGV